MVMEETKRIQEAIRSTFGMKSRDREVLVTYEGEDAAGRAKAKNLLTVEIKKERPRDGGLRDFRRMKALDIGSFTGDLGNLRYRRREVSTNLLSDHSRVC